MFKKDISTCTALLLDSGGGWNNSVESSYTHFGVPSHSFYSKGYDVIFTKPHFSVSENADPFAVLEDFLSQGYFAIGYIGYEYSKFTQEGFYPRRKKEGVEIPDVYFLIFNGDEIDTGSIEELLYKKEELSIRDPLKCMMSFTPNMSKDDYLNSVKAAKLYIERGDIYQVNLSQRFSTQFGSNPLDLFLKLFCVQPVPFGCYINFGEFQILSGSMELFLRKIGSRITTRPIKGTRPRGSVAELDHMLRNELITSEKERSENLMIVDLMRNDLSRICKDGTVTVKVLFSIESYSTIHQMVSEIEAQLSTGVKARDIIENTFPPGSVTGAPKRRAIELIDMIEPHLRGPYCGAIGLFKPDGDLTLSVAIRILLINRGVATFWVGGGIVWDSDPEKEYIETLIKAQAIKEAMIAVC
ncbi:MAG: aminodeoxychorismate synthase component I [Thermodesulfobacteriota bacterium]